MDTMYKCDVAVTMQIDLPDFEDDMDILCEDVSEEIDKDCAEFADSLGENSIIIIYQLSNDFKVKDLAEKVSYCLENRLLKMTFYKSLSSKNITRD